jgi:hypothetical protein
MIAALALMLAACAKIDDAELTPLTAADSAEVVENGGAIATAVMQGLSKRLQAQLAERGAAGAVDFCSQSALPLTDSLVGRRPDVTVKRTSTRIRNPRNSPDALEAAAMAWFDSVRAATGRLPEELVQAADYSEVRYYRPLLIAPFCVQCHGAAESIEAPVRAILKERYPQDQAIGYQPGDMRGVIRVSLPRSD